jgi:ribosome-associated protein
MIESANSTINNLEPEYTTQELAFLAAAAADDRKAGDIVLLDISEVSVIADYLLIVSGFSKAQLRAISGSIQEKLKTELHRAALRTEGENQGNWVLLDYGDLIVHIMMPHEREFYNLEAFWGHGELVSIPGINA